FMFMKQSTQGTNTTTMGSPTNGVLVYVSQENLAKGIVISVSKAKEAEAPVQKVVEEYGNKSVPADSAGLKPEEIQQLRSLVGQYKEASELLDQYRKKFGALPADLKSLEENDLKQVKQTISNARAIGNRLNFLTACIAEQNLSTNARKRVEALLE